MQRQNNQVMLNLGTGTRGEAQSAAAQETEIGTAKAFLTSFIERSGAGKAVTIC
jgi:hypothetical protein